jgi:protoheme IX farnesyltransferase
LTFGLVLSAFAVADPRAGDQLVCRGFLAFTIFFYAVVYTMWLKRFDGAEHRHRWRASGAFPPMIGWAAVTGGVSLDSFLLFLMIFIWTPPHFWALALVKSEDYARAGVPMLPVVAGPDATRLQILLYTLLLAPVGLAPYADRARRRFYGGCAIRSAARHAGFGRWHLSQARGRSRPPSACWRMFGFSILYLFGLFAALLIERSLLPSVGWGLA